MSDNREEAEEKMAKAIFISADCWLSVFDLLPPRQLGHGIAFVSHRFDFYVDEHFKTRRWALKPMEIWRKIEADGTNGIEIVNYDGKLLPIPQKALPKKIVGFKSILINYIDQNAIAFLQHFRQLFASCPINLAINTSDDSILESFLRNIFPMIDRNIDAIQLPRCFVPSILNGCPSLRVVNAYSEGFFAEFPADDSAKASDGQALAKWLFTPRPDNVPKVFKCWLQPWWYGNLSSSIGAFKAAFANASSPVNFIVVIWRPPSSVDPNLAFDQTNELTREQLTLKWMSDVSRFLLIRCPIVRDTDKWAKWEKEAIDWQFNGQWNRIDI
ncbi:hypothetical protein niasHT_017726 [Heterodera trifolii]|uniref:Uncharacterized protein n=1 Tax=Heterodera trifolii TaxID=157864 RepID=A0ABD2L741_9BILA